MKKLKALEAALHAPRNRALMHVPNAQLAKDRSTMTLREMAEKYQCHPSTISKRLKQIGEGRYERPRYTSLIPWKVRTDHDGDPLVHMLRLLGRLQHGRTLGPAELVMLSRWVMRCVEENLQVEYDYEEGFSLVEQPEQRAWADHPYFVDWLIHERLVEDEFARHTSVHVDGQCSCGFLPRTGEELLQHRLTAVEAAVRVSGIRLSGAKAPGTSVSVKAGVAMSTAHVQALRPVERGQSVALV
jgi:hypothetical protein